MTQSNPTPAQSHPVSGRRSTAADAAPVRHIALAFPVGLAHLQPVLQGITDYARRDVQGARWVFTTSPEMVTMPVQSLAGWQGAGVIAVLLNRADVRAARALRLPTVTFSGAMRDAGVPRVRVDNRQVGRLAAEHLHGCGFRRFAFYGLRGVAFSQDRGEGFAAWLAEAGFASTRFLSPNALRAKRPWLDEMEKLDGWVAGLELPTAIFAVTDQRARMAVDAARRRGLRVPEDVAVLGVDNDQVACEFSDPPLSSIACNWYDVGYESARLLDRLMAGGEPPAGDLLVVPDGVVARHSTRVQIIDHAGVALAVAHVRDHLSENFGVEALLAASDMTRRKLEISFKKALGCTPHTYICRARVERAKELLSRPQKMKLTDIARECGFHDLRRLRVVFRRLEKQSPVHYRRAQRRRGGGDDPK